MWPEASAVEEAMSCVGTQYLELDERAGTVRFGRAAMTVDLGALGKGYAIDRAVEMLREDGVESGLLHGGTSTAFAWGTSPEGAGWSISVEEVLEAPASFGQAALPIQDLAVSISAQGEKSFRRDGVTYGHVIDPRSGWPVQEVVGAMVTLPRAADADAWSTGLLVLGMGGVERLLCQHPAAKAIVTGPGGVRRSVGVDPSPRGSQSVFEGCPIKE